MVGSANNQLAEEGDDLLAGDVGVLYAPPDFMVNSGGLINVAENLGLVIGPERRRPAGRDDRHDHTRTDCGWPIRRGRHRSAANRWPRNGLSPSPT